MREFLKMCKENVTVSTHNCLVIGNFYGDFSSIMSTLSFAFYMQNKRLDGERIDTIDYYVPFVNMYRSVVEINTDVMFYLNKFGIKSEDLFCLDDLEMENFYVIALINYNSHFGFEFEEDEVFYIFSNSEEEYDFVPQEYCLNENKASTSIATVVAHHMIQDEPHNLSDDEKVSLKILYDCILYDIRNDLNAEAYPEEVQILSDLEGYLGIPDDSYAQDLVNDLLDAAIDISRLNALQLITKYSTGPLTSSDELRSVYIAKLPIGIDEFFKIPDFRKDLAELAEWQEISVLILIGDSFDEDYNKKESIGIVNFTDSTLYKMITDKLVHESELKLNYRGWFLGFNGKWYANLKPEICILDLNDLIQPLLDQ